MRWIARVMPLSAQRASRRLWPLALLLCIVAGTPAALVSADLTVIARDGFEAGSYAGGSGWANNWNVSSAISIVDSGQPRSGGRHLELRGAAVASRVIDLSGWTDMELGFWAKARSLEDNDFVALEVSSDGKTWETLEAWLDGDDEDRYYLYEFDLPAQVISQALWVRFISQMDEPSDYFYVDDVLVQGEPASGGATAEVITSVPVAPVVSTLSASASGSIVIDGVFSDWSGYPNLLDPAGDASKVRGDLSAFYWGNNGNTEVNYWVIERHPGNGSRGEEDDEEEADEDDEGGDEDSEYTGGNSNWQTRKVKYTIYVDTNDDGNFDGNFSGQHDRRVMVDYKPKLHHSDVRVKVKPGSGGKTLYSAEGDWGESITEGGRRVELAVFWEDLGITNGNVIRMYVESNWNDRLPNSGDIQWSPASILGFWLLTASATVGAVALWHLRKRKEEKCLSGLA